MGHDDLHICNACFPRKCGVQGSGEIPVCEGGVPLMPDLPYLMTEPLCQAPKVSIEESLPLKLRTLTWQLWAFLTWVHT